MKTLTIVLKEVWEEKKKYFENVDFYAKKIKDNAEKILGKGVKVFLFGSIVKGNWTANSDIDVLIVSDKIFENLEENLCIKTKIKSSISPFSPFQIHLVSFEEFEKWYKNFIKDSYKEVEDRPRQLSITKY